MARPAPQGQFLVAAVDDVVFTRLTGLGTMQDSIPFKQFLEASRQRGFRTFIFDLGPCGGFDSTFMGMLLGLALGGAGVVLINVGEPQRKLLEDVGIHRVVDVRDQPVAFPDIPLEALDLRHVDDAARLRHVLDAHENLARHDPRNQERFGSFLELVRRELGGESSP